MLWRGAVPLPGAADAVAALRSAGEQVVFLTNNSALAVGDYAEKLASMGVPASAEEVVSSAQAAARLVEPGERVVVVGGRGVVEALSGRGATIVAEGPADAVMVGWDVGFGYATLAAAMSAVRGGARLIGTNDDATYPTPEGELPGGGAILAAVAYASSAVPVVAGKPHEPMAALVAERFGTVDVMVGDRPSTDGLMARRLGARFALVLSGVTTAAEAGLVDPQPDVVADDLASLVAAYAL